MDLKLPPDDYYQSDFHREWNEACMKERERTRHIRYTVEYLRAQTKRMDAQVKELEETEREKREKRATVYPCIKRWGRVDCRALRTARVPIPHANHSSHRLE